MDKKYRLPKFWKLALAQLALAILLVLVVFYVQTKELLAGPRVGDLYAYTWEFQSVVFILFWLPATLLCAGIFLIIERQLLKPYYLAQQTEGRRNAA